MKKHFTALSIVLPVFILGVFLINPLFSRAATILIPASASLIRNLSVGSTGDDVKILQQFLNANGFTIASTGPGSVGNETTMFGGLTKSALIKFQEAYRADILTPLNLTNGTGNLYTSTRNFINSILHRSGSSAIPFGYVMTPDGSIVLRHRSGSGSGGSSGSDNSILGTQSTPTFSPTAGAIAYGNVTITSADADHIYYTTNGDDPTTGSASISSGGTVNVDSALTLKAMATRNRYNNSSIGSAVYTQATSSDLTALTFETDYFNGETVESIDLSPTFGAGTYTYTSRVSYGLSTTTILTTGSGVIQYSVDGSATTTLLSGISSDIISLSNGEGMGATTTIMISHKDTGMSTTTYSIEIYRDAIPMS